MVADISAELPSYDDVVLRFSLFDTGRTGCDTQIGEGGSLRCDCHGCTDWYAFLGGELPYGGGAQYEVFTKEHLQGLANYIRLASFHHPLLLAMLVVIKQTCWLLGVTGPGQRVMSCLLWTCWRQRTFGTPFRFASCQVSSTRCGGSGHLLDGHR